LNSEDARTERRRHRRFAVGVPVRLRAEGSPVSTMIELSDVSFRGCRMRTLSDSDAPAVDARVAFGFVMADRNIALARARVVRHIDEAQGGGIGLVIDRANVAFYEFLMTLAEGESSLAA
jgi:PilZ domain